MDVFGVRDRLIEDYRQFTGSFVDIHDKAIREHVDERMAQGYQWPDPWLSLNPSFASGGTVSELVDQGLLQPAARDIFRLGSGQELRLHRHQKEAIEAARTGKSYVLTTGTGSGKSLAYMVPIVDRVLAAKAEGSYKPGIKAIVVYPMNALANSQLGELEKFLGTESQQVSFARYTGQESSEKRAAIIRNPPDILLTNYVMLELVLTRPRERGLVNAAKGLWFLVLDELHTYRGRQGADVALLVRRLRDSCDAPNVQCIGTSATMTTEGGPDEQRKEVAKVASTLFGVTVEPSNVIGETLKRITDPAVISPQALRDRISNPAPPADYSAFVADPLATWIEEIFGFEPKDDPGPGTPTGSAELDADADAPRRRRCPPTIPEASRRLAEQTGTDEIACAVAIKEALQAGSRIDNPSTGRPIFAFRLHQFLSKGDNVYVTLEPPTKRHVTSTYQVAAPGASPDAPDRILVPTSFCRECGQEYLSVAKIDMDGTTAYRPRQDNDAAGGNDNSGYLFISDDQAWPTTPERALTDGRLPYSWVTYDPATGGQMIDPAKVPHLPTPVYVEVTGREVGHDDAKATYAAYLPSPFRFCLRCRTSYEQARGSDFAKLAKLSAEGRSSAMTLVTESIVRTLRAMPANELDEKAKKLLAFVDNRQDASLQAGHFNDFVQVTQLRGALFRALSKAEDGLTHELVAKKVTDELGLSMADFAQKPDAKFSQKTEAERALREVTGYRLYLDLERGWRVTMPNLEQTGLLRITYRDLEEIAADEGSWVGAHQALREDDPDHRREVAATLLDELRRNLAIDVDYLAVEGFDLIANLSRQHLKEPWSLPERERPPIAGVAFPGPSKPGRARSNIYLSGRGQFGTFIRREYRKRGLKATDANEIITDLFTVLSDTGMLVEAVSAADDDAAGYRLRAAVIHWRKGTESGAEDRVRRTLDNEDGPRVNPFFRDLYKGVATTLSGLRAKEHTAQVPPADRQEREDEFSKAALPVLYCSPTMELGVDIDALSAVGLRNVPPTPANYAQRAGRAGRSGQPALVVTYCATGNAHDQYYFRRPEQMVGGAVAPPRLDLANEDLVKSHVQAIWLAETGQDLHGSLTELLDVAGDNPSLELLKDVKSTLNDQAAATRAADRARTLLAAMIPDLERGAWWRPTWIEDTAAGAADAFNDACERWRVLHRTARQEFDTQSKKSVDTSVLHRERELAARRANDARIQLNLLANENSDDFQTDFYSYRYFASEGFLPGYSFPRLPLAAYIPGMNGRREGDYIQRPRFIGIAEFGPGAVIYHEGARYQVVSVTLPPSQPGKDGTPTTDARRCRACGYLHDGEKVGIDLCQNCRRPLQETTRDLLRLTTVRTQRRDRISSDEEERRRSGFELQTSYRFAQHGAKPGRMDAAVKDETGDILDLAYGDSATIRITNVGRRRRMNPNIQGYLIDVATGRWLKENEKDEAPEEDGLEAAGGVKRKQRVIPYVEDRRNILVSRLTVPVSLDTAITAAIALERGIEAAFQLEDSELSAEGLPDEDGRGRALFVESAEGGAGVLRRLVDDPAALRTAARTALQIMHFNPDTGEDESTEEPGRERCMRACYECLLSYGNQTLHEQINRHLVRDLMLRLAAGQVESRSVRKEKKDQPERTAAPPDSQPDSPEGVFVAWLRENGYREPDGFGDEVFGVCPDLIYRFGADGGAGVFFDDADLEAHEVLREEGWTVVKIGSDADWQRVARRYPSVFGGKEGTL